MQSVLTQAERPENGMRERRCIATGEVLPEARLIRFVLDPDGSIVPDIAAKLPGRGYWVSAERAAIERAATRRLFAKVAGPCRCRPPFIASPSNLPTSRVGDGASFTKTFIRLPDMTILMWIHPFSRSGARV